MLLGQETLRAAPSAIKTRLKPIATPEVDGIFDIVRVSILELREQLNKLQVFKSTVRTFDTILIVVTVSVYLLETCKDSTMKFPLTLVLTPLMLMFLASSELSYAFVI
jgi:hypothetical protein